MRRAAASAACLCLVAGLTARGQRSHQTERLAPGTLHERDLGAGQVHPFDIHLDAGQFLHVVIAPRGIDVAVTLIGPDGRELLKIDLADDGVTTEQVLTIAQTSGRYELAVKSVHANVPAGRYGIRIDALRQATDLETVRVDAMRKLEAGARLRDSGDARASEQSVEPLQSALAGFRQARDRDNEARALLEYAIAAGLLARADALALTLEAHALYRDLGNQTGLAKALVARAVVHDRLGEMAAMNVLLESLALCKATANIALEAAVHNRLGVVHGRTGEPERAIDEFAEALRLARSMQLTRLEAGALNNLGIATKDLGDYRLSLDYYAQSLSVVRSRNRRGEEANVLNNIGNLQRMIGEHRKALESHQGALTIAREVRQPEHEARALNTLGSTFYRLGDFRQALEHHEEALVIRRRLGDPAGQASALDGAGLAQHRLGDSDRAVAHLNEALRIRRAIAARLGEADTLRHLALVERDRGKLAAALDHIEAAVELTDSLRAGVVSPDLRASFVASEHEQYELHIDILMQLHQQSADAAFAARALEASERGRARVLLESLLESRTDVRRGIDPALLESERAAQRELDRASARLSRLLSRESDPKDIDAARGALETVNSEYRQLQVRIRQESPGHALTQPRSLTTREIQRELVDADTLLLEYALGEKRSWLWTVGPTTLVSFELPSRLEIETAARRMYQLLTARQPRTGESPATRSARVAQADRELRRESMSLGRMLLGAASSHFGAAWQRKRLLIVAPEVLQYIPFSALSDPANGARALVADHEIINLPSAAVLAAVRKQTEGRPQPAKHLAVLADPVFDVNDPRINAIARTPIGEQATQRPDVSLVARAMRSMDVVNGTQQPRLSRLPFSREEARAIASLVRPAERLEATGFRASRATVTRGDLGQYRLVHFATHGFFNRDQPELSGLVLSLVDRKGNAQDGFLRLNDIYNLRLPAEVVVLSACQSALGKQIRGEGLVGLTRGFMYAGARRVVASLWQVDDLATGELMRRFYAAMLKDGLRPSAALRAAQRDLARDKRWRSPFFWSAFVLQGEWQ